MPEESCLFCHPEKSNIIATRAHAYVAFESKPVRPGHVAVFSKAHVERFAELDEEAAAEMGADGPSRHLVKTLHLVACFATEKGPFSFRASRLKSQIKAILMSPAVHRLRLTHRRADARNQGICGQKLEN